MPGGSKRQYAYDPLMRVKEILATDPAKNPLMHYRYSYDKMDNITEKATEHGIYLYGYDALYRLTAADNPTLPKEAYTYDGVGNRLTSTEHQNWSYNANNELASYNGITFQYDANGNTTQKNDNGAVTNYRFNTEDRLTQVTDGAGSLIASYYYDPFGRRLWKEVAGVRTYFVYADEGLIAEADAAGTVTKTYGYRPGSTWTTDPLFMQQGGQCYFYQNDHLGTPQKLTSVSGAMVWGATYKAFGEVEIWPQSSVVNHLRFPGQYYDFETGIQYNYFRYLMPISGRYLNTDPIGFAGGYNLYIYGNGNPVKISDNFGLWPSQLGLFVHQRAIFQVIGKKLPREQHLALVEGQVIADSEIYQGSEFAYRHAMRGDDQTAEEARILANEFVRKQMETACKLRKEGNTVESLIQFSIGLHTLQDWTSPTHHGFQLWSQEIQAIEIAFHLLGELYNPGYGSELYRVTRDAWKWYNNCQLPCGDLFEDYGVDERQYPELY